MDYQEEQNLIQMLETLETKLQKKFTNINDQMTALQQRNAGGGMLSPGMGGTKSLARQFVESDAFAAMQKREQRHARIEVKNAILGTAGSPAAPVDTIAHYQSAPGIYGGATRALTVLDFIPRGTATAGIVHFTKEAAFTNAAAETTEGALKPEASLTFTDVDAPVQTIAHWLKATRQVLDDAPALEAYIGQRLVEGVRRRLEAQIIAGDGTGANLSGMTDSGNNTPLSVASGDNDLDAANRAMHQIINADWGPSAFIVNPTDWGRISRKKTGVSGDQRYLIGEGAALGYIQGGLTPSLWGLPVLATNSCPPGEFVCFSSQALILWERQSTVIEAFEQDGDNVQRNLVTLRAEGRWALGIFAPAGIVTGDWPEAA